MSSIYRRIIANLCDGDTNHFMRGNVLVSELETLVLKYL